MTKIQAMTFIVSVAMGLVGCSGQPVPARGPVYYTTGDVVKVVYGQMDAQIACARMAGTGSHVKEGYCYTAEEVVERHERDAREVARFGFQRCPEPALCKR